MLFIPIIYGVFGGYLFWKIFEGINLFKDRSSGKIRGAGIILLPFLIWSFLGDWWVLLPIFTIAIMGIYDDIKGLDGRIKLALTGIISIIFASRITPISIFGYNFLAEPFNFLFWFLFLLGFTNAFNVIDGKDGILLSTSIVVFTFLFLISQEKLWIHLAGILTGLLLYNSPPAKVIMGDVGAYTLGFLASWGFFKIQAPFEAVLLVLFFPFVDTTLAFFRRLIKGKNIFERDEEHIHHKVSRRFGDRTALALNFLMNILGSSMAYFYVLTGEVAFLIFGYSLWVVYILLVMRF
jgi:UDP-GlcNAc:undecaprenyl-phosphate GlcNAc-1-phosphate transferase